MTETVLPEGMPVGDAGRHPAAFEVIADLPSLLVNATGIDACLDEMLGRVGTLLNGERAFVMMDEKDGKYLRMTHEWINPAKGATNFAWPLYDYEYDIPSLKGILEKTDVYFGYARHMPDDLSRILTKQSIDSILLAPVQRDGKRIGLTGVTFHDPEYSPRPECRPALHALAGLVGLALERKGFGLLRGKLAVIQKCVGEIGPYVEAYETNEDADDSRAAKPTTLLDAERRIIVETLELYNGNKLKTAKHLGLTWPSLDRRCKKLGIEVARR